MGIGAEPAEGFDLTVGVDAQINGNLHMVGDIISEGDTGDKISFNEGTWIYGSMTSLFATTNQIGKDADSTTEIRGTLSVMSDTTLTGALTVKKNIDITDAGSLTVDGNFTLNGEATFSAPENIKMGEDGTSLPAYIKKYSKSLLNITFGSDDEAAVGVVGEAAKVSNGLKFTLNETELLTYDGSEERVLDFGSLAFADSIKKKVNITMSGTYTVPMGGYYTRSGPYTAYEITDKIAYQAIYRYCYYEDGSVYGPVAWRSVPSGAPYVGFYAADTSDSTDYVAVSKTIAYYTTTAASDRSINLTGSQTLADQEFVASDTDDDIDFTVSGITFTVPDT